MDDILKGAIGSEGAYDVDFKGGKLLINASYNGSDATVGLSVAVSVDVLLDKIKEKIPGKIDDAIIDILKAALKAV